MSWLIQAAPHNPNLYPIVHNYCPSSEANTHSVRLSGRLAVSFSNPVVASTIPFATSLDFLGRSRPVSCGSFFCNALSSIFLIYRDLVIEAFEPRAFVRFPQACRLFFIVIPFPHIVRWSVLAYPAGC